MKSLNPNKPEYCLHFDPLQDNGSIVGQIDRATGEDDRVRVNIDDRNFKHRIQQEFPPVIAYVIDLAVAIHASDRLTIQDPQQPQVQLKVVLPAESRNVV
jgi:hypothetical protein